MRAGSSGGEGVDQRVLVALGWMGLTRKLGDCLEGAGGSGVGSLTRGCWWLWGGGGIGSESAGGSGVGVLTSMY